MINPLGALVLLKEIKEEEKTTKSGFILTQTSTMSDLKKGEIVALGLGDRDKDGNYHPIPLNIGDIVLYNDGQATQVADEGENFQFINWNHLFGVANV